MAGIGEFIFEFCFVRAVCHLQASAHRCGGAGLQPWPWESRPHKPKTNAKVTATAPTHPHIHPHAAVCVQQAAPVGHPVGPPLPLHLRPHLGPRCLFVPVAMGHGLHGSTASRGSCCPGGSGAGAPGHRALRCVSSHPPLDDVLGCLAHKTRSFGAVSAWTLRQVSVGAIHAPCHPYHCHPHRPPPRLRTKAGGQGKLATRWPRHLLPPLLHDRRCGRGQDRSNWPSPAANHQNMSWPCATACL